MKEMEKKGRGCHWYTYLSMFVLYETEKDERGTFYLKKMNAICDTHSNVELETKFKYQAYFLYLSTVSFIISILSVVN